MKKTVVTALMLALAVSASGCGEKKDDIGNMEFSIEREDIASVNQEDVLSGTWQTASIGYEMDGELQPEYYETWNEEEFGDAYRGGSSLSRCN